MTTTQPSWQVEIEAKYKKLQPTYQNRISLDIEFRREQLRNLYYAIQDNEQLFKDAVFSDFNKPHIETEITEINECLAEAALAIDNLAKWAKPTPIGGITQDIKFAPCKTEIEKSPYGQVLIIGPWNYPFLLLIAPLISAIAAGNTVMMKPSELCNHSTTAICQVLQSALSESVFQIVTGAVEETNYLLNKKWDKIMFTGSVNVGKIIAKKAAETLTPVVLELGGKSPAIITANANLELAGKRLAWAKMVNAGQTCIAPDFVIVDSEVADEFVFQLKNAIKGFYPELIHESYSTDFAHIVNERLYNRIVDLVSKTKGYVWQWGRTQENSLFFPPTVVRNVQLSDSLMQEELFAPVLPIIETNDLFYESYVINKEVHENPLAAYIFTDDKSEQKRLLKDLKSGAVMINDALMQGGSTAIPFGGVGSSGVGRYHGKYGFDEFSLERPVVVQPSWTEYLLEARYPPYTQTGAKLNRYIGRPQFFNVTKTGPVKRVYTLRHFVAYIVFPIFVGVCVVLFNFMGLFK